MSILLEAARKIDGAIMSVDVGCTATVEIPTDGLFTHSIACVYLRKYLSREFEIVSDGYHYWRIRRNA